MAETAYETALGRLYDRLNYERTGVTPYTEQNYRLDRMRQLLDSLDNPMDRYPIVHIAGTKGKGTTAHLMYDALRANGRKVGLYSSPHLLRVEERFQYDGRMCTEAEFVDLVDNVLKAACQLDLSHWGPPTFFELTTAMGMLFFAQQGADCAVVEVGMGGRLDSTNVCSPLLTLITSISLDHQAQLGSTIRAISREKAGIIKAGVPVISTALHPDAIDVIACVAGEKNAPYFQLERDFFVQWQPQKISSTSNTDDHLTSCQAALVDFIPGPQLKRFSLGGQAWPIALMGQHQATNLGGVIMALDWLSTEAGWKLDPAKTRNAIAKVYVPGRLQLVSDHPLTIIDTAHNPASVAAAIAAIDQHFGKRETTVIFASSKDKDYRTMLELLMPVADRLICTSFQKNPRATSPEELLSIAQQMSSTKLLQADTPSAAWQMARQYSPADGLILVIGSFFLAAELLEEINVGIQ